MKILFALLITGFLFGCSQPLQITTRPADRPTINVPDLTPSVQRPIEWAVINRDNLNSRLASVPNDAVVFVLDSQGYQDLNINIGDLRRYIMQQQAVIQALRQYYESNNNANVQE